MHGAAASCGLANREEIPLILLEVQTGSYFGADGVECIEDAYNAVGRV